MKAIQAIGWRGAFRYLMTPVFELAFGLAAWSPLRTALLRLLGAKIGRGCVIHRVRFMNLYRGQFSNLSLGDECFVGDDALIDLAGPLRIGHQATISARATLLTHFNVGYVDHPLRARFPSTSMGASIGNGAFVGAGTVVLDGAAIEDRAFCAAGSVVRGVVPEGAIVGGVPARPIGSRP